MASVMRLIRRSWAMIALLVLVSPAFALSAHWHGVRSDSWNDGILGFASNWYSKPPPNGAAREVPDGTAYFEPGAQKFKVFVDEQTTIEKMVFSGPSAYTITVQNFFNVTGDGVIVKPGAARPHFKVRTKIMAFFARSTPGKDAVYEIGKKGLLDLTNTRGPLADRKLNARNVDSAGRLFLGYNLLRLKTFRQAATGFTKLQVTSNKTGGIKAASVVLSGDLSVVGTSSVTPGQYVLIEANARIGKFGNVTFSNFAPGLTQSIKYSQANGNVVLVVK